MATITVGYYPTNLNKYFPGAWSALVKGLQTAMQEWAKWANITWKGAVYPKIYICGMNSTKNWGEVRNGNAVYVTYSRKVWKTDAQWKDPLAWKALFLHELAHILVSSRHCDNPIPGTKKKCLLTISGSRADVLCPTCLKKLQTRYGKPKA